MNQLIHMHAQFILMVYKYSIFFVCYFNEQYYFYSVRQGNPALSYSIPLNDLTSENCHAVTQGLTAASGYTQALSLYHLAHLYLFSFAYLFSQKLNLLAQVRKTFSFGFPYMCKLQFFLNNPNDFQSSSVGQSFVNLTQAIDI